MESINWYALRSKPNQEFRVWNSLLERGIETYFPLLNNKPVNPRSHKSIPFFPGYLFVRGTLTDLFTKGVLWLPGSASLVSFDGIPSSIPDMLIEAIRRQVERRNQLSSQPGAGLKQGDPVRIQDGILAGYDSIFERCINGSERVLVLLRLLDGRKIRMDVPVSSLKPIHL